MCCLQKSSEGQVLDRDEMEELKKVFGSLEGLRRASNCVEA